MRRRDFLARLSAAPVIGAMVGAVASAKATEAPGGPRLYIMDEIPDGPERPRWGEWDRCWAEGAFGETPHAVIFTLLRRSCLALSTKDWGGISGPIPRDHWVLGIFWKGPKTYTFAEDARSPRAKMILAGRLAYSAGDPVVLTDANLGVGPPRGYCTIDERSYSSFGVNRAQWADDQMAHVMAAQGLGSLSRPCDLSRFRFTFTQTPTNLKVDDPSINENWCRYRLATHERIQDHASEARARSLYGRAAEGDFASCSKIMEMLSS